MTSISSDESSPWSCGSSQLLKLRISSECLEGEDSLLEEMRALLGPFASDEKLLSHLRAVRGRVNWAVNRYLREELMSKKIPDFHSLKNNHCQQELQHSDSSASQEASNHTESQPSNESEAAWTGMPDGVWQTIFSHLDHSDLCRLALTCSRFRQVASSDWIWKGLFESRWGAAAANTADSEPVPVETASTPEDGLTQETSPIIQETDSADRWRQLFRQRLVCERLQVCPECKRANFVPIVYGFPSGELVDGLKEEKLVLGGDHLIDFPFYSPLWACLGCGTQWRVFPYSKKCSGPFLFPVTGAKFS